MAVCTTVLLAYEQLDACLASSLGFGCKPTLSCVRVRVVQDIFPPKVSPEVCLYVHDCPVALQAALQQSPSISRVLICSIHFGVQGILQD